MEKLLHISNITTLASQMERQLNEFEKKNSDKAELVLDKKKNVVALVDAGIFLSETCMLISQVERENLKYKIENIKLQLQVEQLKKRAEEAEEKYEGLINFDKGK